MNEIQLKNNYYVNLLSKYINYLLLFGILGGYFIAFLIGRLDPPLIIDSLLIVTPISAAIIFFNVELVKKYSEINYKELYYNFKTNLTKIFFIFYIVSIIVLLIFPTRPWFYFVIITLLFILLFIQILNINKNLYITLFQNILLSLNFSYGITLKYPYYFGMTDYLSHIYYAKYISIIGHTITQSIDITYANFPLYHILMAISSLFSLLDIKTTTFLVTGFIFSLTIIFVYYIFYITTGNQTRSLMISLIYSALSPVIFSGHYMVTRCMAYVGFVILIFLLVKLFNTEKHQTIYKILLVIISLFILTVHQVSLPQFILLLIILLICIYFVTSELEEHIFLIFLIMIFLAYWIYSARDFFNLIVETRTYSPYYESIILNSVGSTSLSADTIMNSFQYVYNNIYYSIIIFFALFGIKTIFILRKNIYAIAFALFAFITMVLFIPTPLINLWIYEWLFRADRFQLFVSPFMAFVMGFGIYYFLKIFSHTYTKNYIILLIIILFGFSVFSSITTTLNSGDSTGLHDNSIPLYFEKTDLQMFDFVHNYINNNATIYSDESVRLYFAPMKYFESAKNYDMKYYVTQSISNINAIQNFDGFFLYRQKEFTKDQSLNFYNIYYKYSDINKKYFEYQLDRHNQIYSNKADIIYTQKYAEIK